MNVNINDIEDIIIAKIDIDKDNPDIKERSILTNFINEYCKINWILIYKNMSIPFEEKTIFNKKYIFYSCNNEDEKTVLFKFLKNDLSKLILVPDQQIMENGLNENTMYVIKNSKYYTL